MGFGQFISSFLILVGRPFYRLGMFLKDKVRVVFRGVGEVKKKREEVLIYRKKRKKEGKKALKEVKKILFKEVNLPRVRFLRVTKRRVGFVGVLFFMGAAMMIPVLWFFQTLPSPLVLKERDLVLTTKIYARDGETLLYKIYKTQNRSLVSLDEIPKEFVFATIAIEDKDFYKHRGFSLRGIVRAVRINLLKQDVVEGGSTITQQLIKNALLTPERTVWRKIREVVLAIEAELIYSKDEILTMYFNEVGFGGATYGIEEAAEMYFGKKVSELSLAESAYLAGLPAAPTYYSPYGTDPERVRQRQRLVLSRMYEDGYISFGEMRSAQSEEVEVLPPSTDIKAAHFVMYVKEKLVEKYGEKMVEQGGLTVVTSLDVNIQEMAKREIEEGVTKQNYLNVGNGAALVTKAETGEILAMVGSKDYFDEENDGNVNVTLMARQPGSSIKPVNYAAALLSGYTTTSVLEDSPVTYSFENSKPYSPVNYDGKYRGRVTLREALGSSLNIPAVKVLASYGVEKMISLGEAMGITTWGDRNRFGYALTLGGGEVKMVDMAVVFGTLSNMGEKVELDPILYVEDYKGRVLENYEEKGEREEVLNSGVAFLISDILSDNKARATVFGVNSPLVVDGHTVAVKTGTTDNKKDNWTIGYTPDYVVAVWIGNNDGAPMSPYLESGASGAAPIWHNIMGSLLKGEEDKKFEIPPDVIAVKICKVNGYLTCEGCPETNREYYLRGTEPKRACRSSDFAKREKKG